MNRTLWLVSFAVVLAAAAAAVAADPAPTSKPHASTGLQGEWAIMVSTVKADDAQTAKIKDIVAAAKKAQDEWQTANKAKLDDAKKAMDAAKEAKDKDAMTKAKEQMKTLQDEQAAIKDKEMADVLAVLTADQRLTWEAFTLTRSVKGRLGNKDVKLTDEQAKKVDDMAKTAAKAIIDAPDKAKGANQKFFEDVKEQVLTAEQKAQLQAPSSKPHKEGEPTTAPSKTVAPK